MSEQWQVRRGTTQENDDFTGAEGEITMDTQKKQLRVHDGSTQGGKTIPDIGMVLDALMPDYSRQQTITMPFTATKYGWVIAHAVNVSTTMYVNGVSVAQGNWSTNTWSGNLNCQILVSPGDTVTGAAGTMRFIPCKGN